MGFKRRPTKYTHTDDEFIYKGKQALATRRINQKIKNGNVTRPTVCEVCGRNGKTVAHHYKGYDFPFDVWFVCSKCNYHLPHDKDLSINDALEFVTSKWIEQGCNYFDYKSRFGTWVFSNHGAITDLPEDGGAIPCRLCCRDMLKTNKDVYVCILEQTEEEKFVYPDEREVEFVCSDCIDRLTPRPSISIA